MAVYTKTTSFLAQLKRVMEVWNNTINERCIADVVELINTEFQAIADSPIQATGTLTMPTKPLTTETVTINSRVYKFVAAPSATGDVALGANVAASQANLLLALAGDTYNVAQTAITWSAWASNVLTITAVVRGTAGNAYTLATTVTGASVSGATLAGGANTMAAYSVTSGLQKSMNDAMKACSNLAYQYQMEKFTTALLTEFASVVTNNLSYTVGTSFASNQNLYVQNWPNLTHKIGLNQITVILAAELAKIAAASA